MDYIFYPKVGAMKEKSCFEGAVAEELAVVGKEAVAGTPPQQEDDLTIDVQLALQFTAINVPPKAPVPRPAGVKRKTKTPKTTTPKTTTPKTTLPKAVDEAMPRPCLPANPPAPFLTKELPFPTGYLQSESILKEKSTGSPTLSTAQLEEHDWKLGTSTLNERIDPMTRKRPFKRAVAFDLSEDGRQSPSRRDPLSQGLTRPSSPTLPKGQSILRASPMTTDNDLTPDPKRQRLGEGRIQLIDNIKLRLSCLEGQRLIDYETFQRGMNTTKTATGR